MPNQRTDEKRGSSGQRGGTHEQHGKAGQQSHKNEDQGKSGQRGGSGNFANDPERASEAGRKGGQS